MASKKEETGIKRSKDDFLKSEAQQWACELEFLGHDVLAHCEHCSQDLLHWSPPHEGHSSLCALATQLIWEVERWVLVQIGEKRLTWPKGFQDTSETTYADLRACYQEWIDQTHRLLDPLPDSFLNLYVGSRFGATLNKRTSEVPTVRMCLFSALKRCAILLGQIEVLQQLATENGSLLPDLTVEVEKEQTIEEVGLHAG